MYCAAYLRYFRQILPIFDAAPAHCVSSTHLIQQQPQRRLNSVVHRVPHQIAVKFETKSNRKMETGINCNHDCELTWPPKTATSGCLYGCGASSYSIQSHSTRSLRWDIGSCGFIIIPSLLSDLFLYMTLIPLPAAYKCKQRAIARKCHCRFHFVYLSQTNGQRILSERHFSIVVDKIVRNRFGDIFQRISSHPQYAVLTFARQVFSAGPLAAECQPLSPL